MSKRAVGGGYLYAINFDLCIEDLETYYDNKHPKNAYRDIKKYMKEHGFRHRQWSGYVSKERMSQRELIQFAVDIHTEFPWLKFCEEKMDATIILGVYDLKALIWEMGNFEEQGRPMYIEPISMRPKDISYSQEGYGKNRELENILELPLSQSENESLNIGDIEMDEL